jgi:hypothetical protein
MRALEHGFPFRNARNAKCGLGMERQMKPRLSALASTLALCLLAFPAHAADLTPQAIQKALTAAGYGAERVQTSEEGRALIRSGTNMRIAVDLNGCRKGGCADVHFRTYFSNDQKLDPRDMNRINAAMRFIKVYLDEDGDIAVEMDVDFAGHPRPRIVADSLRLFEQSVTRMLANHAAPLARDTARPPSGTVGSKGWDA